MLVFPSEASDAQRIASLGHRNLDDDPLEARGLVIPNGDEGVTFNALHEAIADGVETCAESSDVFARSFVQALLHWTGNGPLLNQRLSARRVDKDTVGQVAGPQLTDLADASGIRVLVAVSAALSVVGRPQPVLRSFTLLEDELVILERAVRNRLSIALIYGGAPGPKPVEQIVGEDVQVGRRSILYALGS